MASVSRAALIAAVAVGASVTLPGCQTVNTTQRKYENATPDVVADERVTTDSSLKGKAGVVEIREAVNSSGLIQIQAELLNNTRSRQSVMYKFEWIDTNGILVNTPLSRWTPVTLEGKESKLITAVGPTRSTVDFRFKLIESSN